jgi:hypothetical protein
MSSPTARYTFLLAQNQCPTALPTQLCRHIFSFVGSAFFDAAFSYLPPQSGGDTHANPHGEPSCATRDLIHSCCLPAAHVHGSCTAFDTNGVLHYLGTSNGSYTNPHVLGEVVARMSSEWSKSDPARYMNSSLLELSSHLRLLTFACSHFLPQLRSAQTRRSPTQQHHERAALVDGC